MRAVPLDAIVRTRFPTCICFLIPKVPSLEATRVSTAAPTAMMAPWPGGRMASKRSTPNMPRVDKVKVPGGGEKGKGRSKSGKG